MSQDLLQKGILYLQSSQLDEAEAAFQDVLRSNPNNPDGWHLLGIVAAQRKEYAQAIKRIAKAIELQPNQALFHRNIGNAYKDNRNHDQAIAALHRALELDPKSWQLLYDLGLLYAANGNYTSAINHLQDFANKQPDDFNAHSNLGVAYGKAGLTKNAITAFEKALALKPEDIHTLNNASNAYIENEDYEAAIVACRKAIAINPQYSEARYHLALALQKQDKLNEAAKSYQQALAIRPEYPDALNNLGNIYSKQGKFSEAIKCYQKALEIEPQLKNTLYTLGNVLLSQGRTDQVIKSYEEAFSIDPQFILARSNYVFSLHYSDSLQPEDLFREHQKWGELYEAPLGRLTPEHRNDPTPERRLRIGYVSADFRNHSVAFFLEAIFSHHNRDLFEIICYSNSAQVDAVTKRLKSLVQGWRQVETMGDQKVADLIEQDGIDILVDLSGHTRGNRLLVFARKPAPIQVTYLGYPNTTGLKAFDYRFTDHNADPPGSTDHLHTEKLIRLPHGFLCFHPPSDAPEAGLPPCLINKKTTFGSFNNFAKISPTILKCWKQILEGCPESQMILKTNYTIDEESQRYWLNLLEENGIDQNRVQLKSMLRDGKKHLDLYKDIDVALDTFPYNGTTTTCEALWMGVPVVSLAGNAHVSRVGLSLLSMLGLEELVADSADQYVKKAIELAKNTNNLQELRRTLRSTIQKSALTDGQLQAQSLESAYRHIWKQWCLSRSSIEPLGASKTVPTESNDESRLQVEPECLETLFDRGVLLQEQGELEKAINVFQQSLEVNSNQVNVHFHLGMVFKEKGDLVASEKHYRMVITLSPEMDRAYNNLGNVLQQLSKLDDAILCYRKAIALNPSNKSCLNNLGNVLKDQGKYTEAIQCYQKALELDPHFRIAFENLVFILHYDNSNTPAEIYSQHRKWAELHEVPMQNSKPTTYQNCKDPNKRLRIGYVSGDFKRHPVACFIQSLLRSHNHQDYEIYCYSNNSQSDDITVRFQQLSDQWREIYLTEDEQVVEMIQRDDIDILVDLSGHTKDNRLMVFTKKPAPIQISYLGYPNTTGLNAIDYRLVDNYTDPPGKSEHLNSETLIRLPHGFLCYTPPHDAPTVGPSPCLSTEHLTFGSFNNLAKVSSEVLCLWGKILKSYPNSRLILKSHYTISEETACYWRSILEKAGIDNHRVQLVGRIVDRIKHLSFYEHIDIALDTYPYNGTTTTCEALWMGVPVVTLAGDTHVSRVGMSLLSVVGLEELIAHTHEDYVQGAVSLAKDRPRLHSLRQSLRSRVQRSSLTNSVLFTESLEAVYRQIWLRWCQENQTDHVLQPVSGSPEDSHNKFEMPPRNGDKRQAKSFVQEGIKYHHAGQSDLALSFYQQALSIDSVYVDALQLSGVSFAQLGDYPSAISHLIRAIELKPDEPLFQRNLANAYLDMANHLTYQGRIKLASKSYLKALEYSPQLVNAKSGWMLFMHYESTHSPESIYREHKEWSAAYEIPLAGFIGKHRNNPSHHKKIRIGYVSADFRTHSVAFFIESIFIHHNRNEFEIICYSNSAINDGNTNRLKGFVDGWRQIESMQDQQVSELIQQDAIDILVDLHGHTRANRLLVFALRPAPVQVTYMGYPNTTGMKSIDYRLVDGYTDPPGISEHLNSETLIRLPHGFLCYSPPHDAPKIGPPPCLSRGYVTFGCFNNLAKASAEVLALWGKILKSVTNSRLVLKNHLPLNAETEVYWQEVFRKNDIPIESVQLCGRISEVSQHLAFYENIDIALDTFPYNGTTTTCEALWMGVPVISLTGQTHVSRVGTSLLSRIGLTEWIAASPEEYVEKAIGLAQDPSKLQLLRHTLRDNMQASPLMDGNLFTTSLENAYRQMWQQWCHEQQPVAPGQALAVGALQYQNSNSSSVQET